MTEESEQIKFPIGTFTNEEFKVTFTFDGKYFVKREDKIRVEGTYVISGDKIVLTDKSGEAACLESDTATGRYKWKYNGKKLIFNKIEDMCEGRIQSLTNEPVIHSE